MFEQLLFIVLSIVLFAFIFFKIIKKNDTSYLIVIIIEALGIAIDLIFLLANINMNIFIRILIYLMSIVLPLAIIVAILLLISSR